jgi:hypothetical protein
MPALVWSRAAAGAGQRSTLGLVAQAGEVSLGQVVASRVHRGLLGSRPGRGVVLRMRLAGRRADLAPV